MCRVGFLFVLFSIVNVFVLCEFLAEKSHICSVEVSFLSQEFVLNKCHRRSTSVQKHPTAIYISFVFQLENTQGDCAGSSRWSVLLCLTLKEMLSFLREALL